MPIILCAAYLHPDSHIFTTRGAIAKRTAALDSGHQIGLSTSWEDGLTVVGGLSLVESKKPEIGPDFRHISTTKAAMAKGMAGLDSAHQIYPSTPSEDVLIMVGGLSLVESKKPEIGPDFGHISTTKAGMAKRMAGSDLAHQIYPSTSLEDVLTVDEGGCRWRFKNREMEDVFASALGTSGDMAKRMAGLDSAHKI